MRCDSLRSAAIGCDPLRSTAPHHPPAACPLLPPQVWHDTTTYEPYLAEVAYEAPVVGMSADMAARGVGFVLRSLTPNHRQILRLLAEHQAAGAGGSGGIGFGEFSSICQEQMLVANASALRHHMTELKDHALVAERRNADGREVLLIAEDKLQAILAQLKEGGGGGGA